MLKIELIMAHTAGRLKALWPSTALASAWKRQKQVGLGLVLLGVLLLASIFAFLSYQVVAMKGIPEFLPAEDTIFYGEVRTDNPIVRRSLIPFLNETFHINFEKNFEKLAKPAVHLAFLQSGADKISPVKPVLFAEKKEVTPNNQYLTLGFDAKKTPPVEESLATDPTFLQMSENIPNNAIGHFFARNTFFQTIGGYLLEAENGIFITAQATGKFASFTPERYAGNLLSWFPTDLPLFFGGLAFFRNTPLDTQRQLEEILPLPPQMMALVEETARPFLNGEYGLGITAKNNFLFASEMAPALENLESRLPQIIAYLRPDTEDVTLADDSKGKDFVAHPENVERREETYDDHVIVIFQKKGDGLLLAYSVVDGVFLLSSHIGLLENALDHHQNSDTANFKNSPAYQNILSEVLRGSHEVAYLKNFKNLPEMALGLRYEDARLSLFGFVGSQKN